MKLITPHPNPLPKGERESAELLGREQIPEAASELAGLVLDDPDIQIRRAAAIALGRYPGPQSIEVFMATLDDPSPWVRIEALRSLSGIGGQEIIPAIELVSATDADERVRDIASRVLDELSKTDRDGGEPGRFGM